MATSTDPTLDPTLDPNLNHSRFRCFRCHPVSSSPRWSSPSVPRPTTHGGPSNTPRPAMSSSSCPAHDGVYARVGTLARIEQAGSLPDGSLAAVVRGVARVRIGQGVVGDTAAAVGRKSTLASGLRPRRPSPSWRRPTARSPTSCSTPSAVVN